VFLEAMAHGKPVIGGAHGGIPDIIEDRVTGLLVRHGDVEGLAQALESLLGNSGRATEMGARGKERVAQKFSFLDFEKQLTANLTRVLTRQL
jgi:glycosyltransferase involved in cell wall biosynthesis